MVRPRIRKPPRPGANDGMLLAYDFAPRFGWGTYPARGWRGHEGNTLVWEEQPRLGNAHSMLSRLSSESLMNLVTAGRSMGMVTAQTEKITDLPM